MQETIPDIKTQTLREYIAETMAKLKEETLTLSMQADLGDAEFGPNMVECACLCNSLTTLQEIAYRLEFGFITDIGRESLKSYLRKE